MIRAAVYGAGGYVGAELLRLLVQHPDVTLRQATSREPGRRVDAAHAGLRGVCHLDFASTSPDALEPDLDAVFLALPHGESTAAVSAIRTRCPRARLFDLAQDFRTGHEADGWVYGLPEIAPAALADASLVSCPGCFATAVLLATMPAVACGPAPRRIIVDAKTGSSGSGAAPSAGTHHPERAGTLRAYSVFGHRHEAEILATWSRAAGPAAPRIAFVPQSTPLVRGIYACCYLVYDDAAPDLEGIYRRAYAASPFVRVLAEPPNVLAVRGTNNADLYVRQDGDLAVVIAAIDNLVRGAAGQAVQCMNLAFGLPETRGLLLAAAVP
jgi:N-acetyl-gamma-glutamyl-phosphate reductase